MCMRKYIILFLLLLMIHSASATTVTVGYSGNAGNYNCDGTRDDVQLNDALEYIDGIGGGTVYLKGPNTYWIDDTLEIGADTTLTGDSTAEIKIIDSAGWPNGAFMITGSYCDNVKITGFTIDGNSGEQGVNGGDGYYNMVYLNHADNANVSNMRLEWGCGDGVQIRSSSNVKFVYNDVYKLGHEGLYAIGCSYVEFAYNTVLNRENSACRLSDGNVHSSIHDNVIHGNLGTSPESGFGYTGPAIQIGTSATSGYAFYDIEVYNNKIYDENGAGIWMSSNSADDKLRARDVYIHHNTFTRVGQYSSNTGYSNSGIVITNFNNTIIEHNVIDDGGLYGVRWNVRTGTRVIANESYTYIRNNVITNCDGTGSYTSSPYGTGIVSADTTNCNFVVQNNDIYNNRNGQTYPSSHSSITMSNNLNTNPLFYNAGSTVATSARDYHLRSMAGRWTGSVWTSDGITSPLIDAGYADSSYAYEPAPHGYKANIGRYGNTVEASKSGETYTLPNTYTGSALYTWAYENTTYGITNGKTLPVRNSIKRVYVTILGNTTVSSTSMPSSGLCGWWPLVSNTTDMSGHGITGTAHSITYTGGHANFDGTGSYIDLGKPASIDFTGSKPFTVVARYSFTGTIGTLISSGKGLMGDGDYGWSVPFSSSGNMYLDLYSTTKRSGAYTTYSNAGHIATVWDGSSNQKIYKDGVLAKNYASLISSIGTTQNVKIGVDTPTNAGYWKGQIWDVAIYNRALNATEIQDIYEGSTTTSSVQIRPAGGTYVNYNPAPHILTSGSAITGVQFSTGTATLTGATLVEQANETVSSVTEEEINSYTTNITISHTPGNYTTRGTMTYVVNSTSFKNAAYRGLTLVSNNPNATVLYENETLILNTGPVKSGTAYAYTVTASYSDPANEGETIVNPGFGALALAVYEGGFMIQRFSDVRKKRNFGG